MAEQATTPASAVEPSNESASIDAKIAEKFGFAEHKEPEADAQPEPETSETEIPEGDELKPEELAAEAPADEWELSRNGQKVRVPRDEAVKLAQMGYDYTQKTQALAEDRRALEQTKAAVAARAELTPKLIQAAAKVEAAHEALQGYANVDWVALAGQDPTAYPQHHANFVRLQNQLQQAQSGFQQVWGATQKTDQAINEADLVKARTDMLERIPQWRDDKRRVAEQQKVVGYLESEQLSAEEMARITDPRFVAIARKAMLYDEAIKNRGVKQDAIKQAPAVKPGVAPPRVTTQTQKADTLKQLHQAKDPTRKKALFDEALALKFGLK